MKKNVLIYPSGSDNAIEIYNSLKYATYIDVIPATAIDDISQLIYKNRVEFLPNIAKANFIQKLNALIKEKKIHYIFPTHDSVSLFLAENEEHIDCEILSSNYKTNFICRNKRETYLMFQTFDFCPKVFPEVTDQKQYPIFAKPNIGQGSKGVSLVKSMDEHLKLLNSANDLLFVEFLPGKEFTIDCFTNKNGEIQFVGPRERVEINMGISFRGRAVSKKDQIRFFKIAYRINETLSFRGLWFFQLKEDKRGNLKLLEISTRTAGTMGFFRHKGINLPLITILDFMGFNIDFHQNEYDVELFRATTNRFKYSFDFKRVYIDFTDTLILNGSVNITLLSFIYQCVHLKKEVFIIAAQTDLFQETIRKFNIANTLFEKIIELKTDEIKTEFINSNDAIYIHSGSPNRKIEFKLDMPVFNIDMVNSLIKQ